MPSESKKTIEPAQTPLLRVGFVLLPRFTLTAFAGFIDTLRLAADEDDRSRPLLCHWEVLGDTPSIASCGTALMPSGTLNCPQQYDYIVVVGGLLHGEQGVPSRISAFLREAAAADIALVGLCTGTFALARAGLLDGYLNCVSWFHRAEFVREFPACHVVSEQTFVIDRDRITCAGVTSVVHLAAQLITRHIGRSNAIKALRILIEHQPLSQQVLQPEQALPKHPSDRLVHKAMLLLEQNLHLPCPLPTFCQSLGVGLRQLERRFQQAIALTPAQYRLRLRLERAHWLLEHSDLSMTEISLQCGFADSSSFSRAVRKCCGQSPRELRASFYKTGAAYPLCCRTLQDYRHSCKNSR